LSKRHKNAGEGYGMMFHGAFAEKKDAVAKERKTKGAFIRGTPTKHGYRYIVMSPRTNPIRRKRKTANPATKQHKHFRPGARAERVYAFAGKMRDKYPGRKIDVQERVDGSWDVYVVNEAVSNPIAINPAELIVMGANPPEGRPNPANGLFSGLHRAILGEARQTHPAAGFRSPVHSTGRRKARTSDSELVSALRNLGYSSADSKSAARGATGDSFDARFRSAMGLLRHNPACGVTINPGGHTCTREPGHKGPHLPQGATLRTRSRLPHNWRGNPSAAAIREEFTGAPAEHFTVQDEPHMPAGDYAQLGELLALYFKPVSGGQVQQVNFAKDRPIVVSAESARQIYFVGGVQDITGALEAVGACERSSGLYELGEARRIDYKQRKEHVGHPDADEWRHNFGEESGVRPTLLFDARSKRLLLEGGEYVIRAEGIIN